MSKLKLSDLHPDEVKPVSGLKLSALSPNDIKAPSPTQEQLQATEPQQPGLGQTVVDQGLQGLTMGFSDELAGLGAGASQLATGDFGPKEGRSWEALKAAYMDMRDQQRKKLEDERHAHPVASVAANVVGSIPTAILGGEALGAAGMASKAGQAATMGGVTGLGTSNSDSVTGMAGDTAMGTGLGLAGYGLGKGLSKFFNPEALETSGSKAAQRVVNLDPRKDIPVSFDKDSGRLLKQYGATKGVGTTAMDNGALPLTGGVEESAAGAQKAIGEKFDELKPIINQVQEKLDPHIEGIKETAPLDTKISNYIENFFKKLPNIPQTQQLRQTLLGKIAPGAEEGLENEGFFTPRIREIIENEGDIPALMEDKRKLYQDAVATAKNIYKSPDSYATENTGSFLKGLANVIKGHTEDLASSVDPQAGAQIKGLNGEISHLITFQEAAEKSMGKGNSTVLDKLGAPVKMLTGYGPGQLADVAYAKTVNGLSNIENKVGDFVSENTPKPVSTALGALVQKVLPKSVQATVQSPTAQEANPLHSSPQYNPIQQGPWSPSNDGLKEQSDLLQQYRDAKLNADDPSTPTKMASNLYNATDDSLKGVATSMQQDPSLKFYGDHLAKAIDTNDEQEKNRAIFLMLQNPKTRKLVTPQ